MQQKGHQVACVARAPLGRGWESMTQSVCGGQKPDPATNGHSRITPPAPHPELADPVGVREEGLQPWATRLRPVPPEGQRRSPRWPGCDWRAPPRPRRPRPRPAPSPGSGLSRSQRDPATARPRGFLPAPPRRDTRVPEVTAWPGVSAGGWKEGLTAPGSAPPTPSCARPLP